MKISAKDIQHLREKTKAGVMDCKSALQEAKGDFDKAMKVLRERGIRIAAKKSSRTAKEGRIEAYVHLHNKIGVLVEVNCETDFVAKSADFKSFTKDLAMQIAALSPLYLKEEDVPEETREEHKDDIENFYKTHCLLEQCFVKDQARTVKDYLTEMIARVGENIVVRRFIRFQLGEE